MHTTCIPDGLGLAEAVAQEMHKQIMTTVPDISNRIIEAVMAQKLAPGARLGEQQLAMLFDCSCTIVREALTRLAAAALSLSAAGMAGM